MQSLRRLTTDEAAELESTLQEVYDRESEPSLPVGAHAVLMMVIRKLFNYNATKEEAKRIAERELGRYYRGYRDDIP
jgi:hypothetical protein